MIEENSAPTDHIETLILKELQVCWSRLIPAGPPIRADVRMDDQLDATGEDELDLADFFHYLERHFDFRCGAQAWREYFQGSASLSRAEWEAQAGPSFTFGNLAEFIAQHAPKRRLVKLVAQRYQQCGLCKKTGKLFKLKPLYGVLVCKRCRNGFISRRQIAYLVDCLIWLLPAGLLRVALDHFQAWLGIQEHPGDFFPLFLIGLSSPADFISWWIFPLLFFCKDGFRGMSPGKWLLGVQVVDRTTREPIGFGQSFKRNLVLLVPALGWIIVALSLSKGPRWGDRWANTAVIWRKYRYLAPFEPRSNFCRTCGYDLTGNVSGICPECGVPVPASATALAPPSPSPVLSSSPNPG